MGTTYAKQVGPRKALRVLALIAIVVAIFSLPIEYTEGVSVAHKLFWITGGEIHKGDYVLFERADPFISLDGPKKLTKRVACISGERLKFAGHSFWCNDVKLVDVVDKTKEGKALTPFVWDGPVPGGVAFVVGEHPRSYDSRYFGFVEVSKLTRMVALL